VTARTLLLSGAAVTALGLAIAGTAPVAGLDPNVDKNPTQQVAGGVVVLAGWIVLGYGIHRFGRGDGSPRRQDAKTGKTT
jgi:hypothetical protein